MAETADVRNGRTVGPQRLHGVRVLMMDDEPDTLEALCTVLTMAGATVQCVADATAAFSAVETFDPHVLVCDLYLPETDGWTFMQRARGRGFRVPAVALTAHPSDANRARALACGYVTCIGKPVHPEDFVGVLRAVAKPDLA